MNAAAAETASRPAVLDVSHSAVLHEIFERQANLRSSQPALRFGSGIVTYGELDREANQLARLLRARGVGRSAHVALWLPRSRDLYVALLAILKSGAAYVPIDQSCPPDRAAFILTDCQAHALIATSDRAAQVPGFIGQIIVPEILGSEIALQSVDRVTRDDTGITPDDVCYVIYTSGSTGKPKGVEIEHRSVCHLVRAESQIFQVQPADRVYQGFSIAFDASIEEIWLAFASGATLVPATSDMERAGPVLSRLLVEAGVTVLSCVPTLLSILEEDIPTVRLLILGGEACPASLVARWCKPGRRFFNTYGPTEATVIATYVECLPGQPVTIGRAVPGYHVDVRDEQMRPLPPGVAGELCISGPGLARGYLGRPELTREKFVCALTNGAEVPARVYRSGDLARWTADGQLEFLGRLDSQVKIRGFRVELSEIEAALLQCPGIQSAAVTLREDTPGLQQLVAYVVTREPDRFDEEEIRCRVRAHLPAYMIPSIFERLDALPMLPSGKMDRKSLPLPRSRCTESRRIVAPRSPLEQEIAAVWQNLFSHALVSVRDDFFLDLGGHSLLAARMVSELRRQAPLQELSMLDVYRHPTIEGLAAEFERRQSAPKPSKSSAPPESPDPNVLPVTFWRHFLCGTAQAFSLIFILTFSAVQWLGPYLIYTILVEEEYDFQTAVLGALASLVFLYPLMLLVPILLKWLVIGRYRPGSYPLWGTYFFRWWLVTTAESTVPVGYLAGTPLLNVYLRLMGAGIGRNVHLAANCFAIYDLLSIGDNSSINVDSNLLGYTVENGWLKIGQITIGRNCFVGARAALRENTTMQDGSALEDLSLLPRGCTIPAGETWLGSPASRVQAARPERAGDQGVSRPYAFLFTILCALGLLAFPVLVSAAIFPGIMVMNELNYLDPYYWYLCLSPLVGLSFVVLLCLEIAILKWLLLGRVTPGRYPLRSFYYFRKWFVDQTMDLSLDVLGPLYASVYLAPWYRLLGAEVGRGAEVSTASFISPDLLSLGDESFIADSVSLGAPRIRDGFVTIGRNRVGKRSFIGNSALLPPGAVIGDNSLIGCLSAPPADPAEAARENASWLGSPAIFLPQRQQTAAFPDADTYHPPARLRVLRAAIEFIRVISPSTIFIILLSLMFSALLLLRDHFSLWQTLLFFPPLYILCGIAAAGITIAAKWLLVWRYRPGERPLWSAFVWRNELLNALHEHVAEPFLVGALTSTPFVCWYFRLLGARIGRRVYMETTDFSEFDLARIGAGAALNADCTIQTHLFEDRVMKMSTVDIAPGATVGAGSLVLYDTRMEPGSSLGDLSLLMKGEVLPGGTQWEGVPARCRP